MLHWYKTGITKTLVVVTLLLLASSTRGQEDGNVQEESDRLFLGKSDDNSTNLACRVVTAPLDRCLATLTGNPSITIQLIASYALDIFEFLKTNINFTSLKFFFERIENAVDPKVITSNLTCSCPRPQTNTSGFPWTCQATSSPSIARKTCECINANEDDAFCEIRIDCPVSHPLAVGGRCDNDVQQKTERFHFEDVGFGNPNVLGIPSYTTCNVEVSRLVDQVTVNAYAYCKAI